MNKYFSYKYKYFLQRNSFNPKNISSKVLGVLLRGTDYSERKTVGEHIQPNFNTIKKHIYEVMKKYPEIQKIYVATEDKHVYNLFKNEFGNLILENNQYMYEQKENEKGMLLGEIDVKRENHHYQLAKEYLFSLYLLTKFDYLVAGRCNGSAFAWLMADNFKYFYIYNLGRYPDKSQKKGFLKSLIRKF